MSEAKPRVARSDWLLTSAIILASIAVALAIRIAWPYDTIFVDGNVWFREMDAWYRMRLVDCLVHNFPHMTAYDPFSAFPYGIRPVFHPLTTWLIAVPALLLGGGNPSPELVDTCGAYVPAILGALTVIPVYFIGRHLYGPVAGASGAILIAILPGEFLSRSLLGFTDHHVTEALLSTTVLLFLMRAFREADASRVVLHRPADVASPAYRRTVLFALLAGVSLGLYLLAWRGGVLILALLVVYTVIRCFIDYSRGVRGDDLLLVFPLTGAVAMLMATPTIASHYMAALYILAMVSVMVVPVVLMLLSQLGRRLHWSPAMFRGVLIGCLGLAVTALLLISPTLAGYFRTAIDFMVPTGAHLSIMEMHPLFFPNGIFSLTVAWTNFTTALALSIIALVVLVRSTRSPRGNDITLFLVWSLVMLFAVLLQRRFGYYYAVCAALLCGFLIAWVFAHPYVKTQMQLLRRRAAIPVGAKSKSARRSLQSQRAERRTAFLKVGTLVTIIVAVLCVPSVDMARNFATEPGLMTAGWYETLTWMKDNTPTPLEPDGYYALHDAPPRGEPFPYPPTAYGVMAWWDYGHWITRLSQRIPVANPFQHGAQTAGRYFTAQSEAIGIEILDERGCDYVVVDSRTSLRTFHGVAAWAGQERNDYIELYSQRTTSGTLEPIVLYYPEYYQTMLARLYNFDGKSYVPSQYQVIRYSDSGGLPGAEKLITDLQLFETYGEAQAYIAAANDVHVRLVSADALDACVELEALDSYTLVHESSVTTTFGGQLLPEVKVFEYSLP